MNAKRAKYCKRWQENHPNAVKLTKMTSHDGLYYKIYYHSVNGKAAVTDMVGNLYLEEGENEICFTVICSNKYGNINEPIRLFAAPLRRRRLSGRSITYSYYAIIRDYKMSRPDSGKNALRINLNVRSDAKYEIKCDYTERTVTVLYDYYDEEKYTYDKEYVHGEVTVKSDGPIKKLRLGLFD